MHTARVAYLFLKADRRLALIKGTLCMPLAPGRMKHIADYYFSSYRVLFEFFLGFLKVSQREKSSSLGG